MFHYTYGTEYDRQRSGSYKRSKMNRISNASVVLEKIKILQRIIPQNDAIWENLLKCINNLLFVEVNESVLQQSPISNTNACPGITPQLSSSKNSRFNSSQSTNNTPDVVSKSSQQNILSTPRLLRSLYGRNSRSRNACTTSVPEKSEETDSRNVSEFQYRTYYEYYIHERLVMQEAQNSLRRQSSRTNNESIKESDSTPRSESTINASEDDVLPPAAKNTLEFNDENEDSDNSVAAFLQKRKESTLRKLPSVVNTISSMSQNTVIDTLEVRKPPNARYYFRRAETSSKVNQKRPCCEESATHERRKRPKKCETVEESIQRSSSTSVNSKKIVKPTNSRPKKNYLDLIEFNDENGDCDNSVVAFHKKRKKLTLKKPPVINTDPSMSSPNTVIDIKEARKLPNAKRTKKTSSTQPRKNTKPTVVRRHRQVKASRDKDLNSKDGGSTKASSQLKTKRYYFRSNTMKSWRTRKMLVKTKTQTEDVVVFTKVEFNDKNEDRNDSLVSFFRKQKKLCVEIPRIPFVFNINSSMSSQNTVINTNEVRKPPNARYYFRRGGKL